jgi:hypothetical protein
MLDTPPPVTTQACQAVNKRGAPCRAGVSAGQAFCFAHDPERRLEAAAARAKGGANSKRSTPPATPIDLSTPELQRQAIEQAIDRVRAGDEPLSLGRFVVYAVSLARPVMELEAIAARLDVLEQRMGGQS